MLGSSNETPVVTVGIDNMVATVLKSVHFHLFNSLSVTIHLNKEYAPFNIDLI